MTLFSQFDIDMMLHKRGRNENNHDPQYFQHDSIPDFSSYLNINNDGSNNGNSAAPSEDLQILLEDQKRQFMLTWNSATSISSSSAPSSLSSSLSASSSLSTAANCMSSQIMPDIDNPPHYHHHQHPLSPPGLFLLSSGGESSLLNNAATTQSSCSPRDDVMSGFSNNQTNDSSASNYNNNSNSICSGGSAGGGGRGNNAANNPQCLNHLPMSNSGDNTTHIHHHHQHKHIGAPKALFYPDANYMALYQDFDPFKMSNFSSCCESDKKRCSFLS